LAKLNKIIKIMVFVFLLKNILTDYCCLNEENNLVEYALIKRKEIDLGIDL